jgi:hypothetical protein
MCVSVVAMHGNDNNSDTNSDLGDEDEDDSRIVVQYITARLQQFEKHELVQLVAVTNFLVALDQRLTSAAIFTSQRMPPVLRSLDKLSSI